MTRDVTMIISVLVAVVSLGFGVYKNLEASVLEEHATAQVYRALGAVQDAEIGAGLKNDILFDALGRLEPAPEVVDLSRSSADEPTASPPLCSVERIDHCTTAGLAQAEANAACEREGEGSPACATAYQLSIEIRESACIECYQSE